MMEYHRESSLYIYIYIHNMIFIGYYSDGGISFDVSFKGIS